MKTSRVAKLIGPIAAVLMALFISGGAAFAQETEQEKEIRAKRMAIELDAGQGKMQGEMLDKVKAELFTVLGAKFGFETKLVKGAPYSAVAVSETVQRLGDGNHIRQSSSTTIYRDSAGRTRREMTMKDGAAQAIAISDPTTGVNYTLDPQQRTALKHEAQMAIRKVDTARAEEELKMKLAAEKKYAAMQKSPDADNARKQPVKEPLGRQVIEGIEAEGVRVTTTIPAGQIGNDLPINIVSEQWYSPELQLLVMTKHSDPRTGETTYRLTNINRAEPDRSLFEVPGDYTVRSQADLSKEKLEMEMKLRNKVGKPEDQK